MAASQDSSYWTRNRVSRRQVFRGAGYGALGIAAAALVGCGSDDGDASGTPTSTGATAAGEPKTGGTMTLSGGTYRTGIDPYRIALPALPQLWGNVSHHLLELDAETQELTNEGFAESWEFADDLTLNFKLYDGIKMANVAPVNGRQLTADDVVWSFERIATDDPQFARRSLFETIKSVTAVDDLTVRFDLTEPFAPLLSYMGTGHSVIMAHESIDMRGENIVDSPEQIFGAGPFILEKQQDEIGATLRRNPDYFRPGRPYLDGIRLITFADDQSADAAFRTEEILVHSKNANQYDAFIQSLGKEVTSVARTHSGRRYSIEFNNAMAPFDDDRVRQGLHLIFDRQEYISLAYGGYGLLLGNVSLTLPRYSLTEEEISALPGYREAEKDEDIAEGKRLLAAAGIDEGYQFTIDNTTLAYPIATIWAAQLSRAGYQATIHDVEYGAFKAGEGAKQYAMFAGGYTVEPEADATLRVYSRSDGSRNYTNFADTEIDDLIDQQARTLDPDERGEICRQADRLLIERAPRILASVAPSYQMTYPWVHGWNFTPWSDGDRHDQTDVWLDA